MKHNLELRTGRLLIRRLTMSDAHSIFEYAQSPNVTRYVSWEHHKSLDDSFQFINNSIKLYKIEPLSPLGIVIHDNNGKEKLIGTVSLFKSRRFPNNQSSLELGYTIGEKWWGRGYAYEAANALVSYCFKNMDIQRIEAIVVPENIASFKTLEKLGMQREGIIRKAFVKNGYRYNIYIYSILREEWTLRG